MEKTLKLYITITDASGKKKTVPVTTLPTTIGRSKRSKVQVNDELCSGLHCKAFVENDCLFVEDCESKNGVFLNEIKVKKQRLYIGDEIRIGTTKIKLEDTKLDNEQIKRHTSSHSNRRNGSITLELETFQETKRKTQNKAKKQKEYVKNAKLYEGVAEDADNNRKAAKKLVILEKLATVLDLAIGLGILIGPFAYKMSSEKKLMAKLMKDPTQIIVGENLFYLIGSVVAAIVFFNWNRSREKGTIGETIFKI